jgi:hypothetical protein
LGGTGGGRLGLRGSGVGGRMQAHVCFLQGRVGGGTPTRMGETDS